MGQEGNLRKKIRLYKMFGSSLLHLWQRERAFCSAVAMVENAPLYTGSYYRVVGAESHRKC